MPDESKKDDSTSKTKEEEDDNEGNAWCGAISELLFVLLPFLVITITFAHRGQVRTILSLPEWSLVSSVVVGQSIVKIVSTSLTYGTGGRPILIDRIALLVAVLMVCVLVPCLTVLSLVLTSDHVSRALACWQIILFLLATFLFTGVTWLHRLSELEK
jgi:hypothetical protein